MREKKNSLELWNFIFVALGDTNDGRNIASVLALKFEDFQEKNLEHYTWCLTWNAWRDRNGLSFYYYKRRRRRRKRRKRVTVKGDNTVRRVDFSKSEKGSFVEVA